MRQKLSLSLEEKKNVQTTLLTKNNYPEISRHNQNVYCGGIVYHYLHQNQSLIVNHKKLLKRIKKRRAKMTKSTGGIQNVSSEHSVQIFQPSFFYEPIKQEKCKNT
jgi:hypothetical protein